jgi:hypothetical protein
MFERFTDSARAAVVGAQTEARALGHGWIGTEHLLLAVLREPERPVARQLAGLGLTHDRLHAEVVTTLGGHHDDGSALRDLGIDLDAVRARVEEQFGPGALDPQPAPARRGRVRRCGAAAAGQEGLRRAHPVQPEREEGLELALRESVGLGSREILVEHLVLGLMRAEGWPPRGHPAGRPPTTYAGRCWTARARGPTAPSASADRGHDLVADVEVGPDVLHVVGVLERLDQAEDLLGAVLVERHADRRQERRLGRVVVDAGVLQRGAHGDQVGGLETTSNASPRSLTSSAPASSTARARRPR